MGISSRLKLSPSGNYGIVMPSIAQKEKISKAHMFMDSYRNTGHIKMLMNAIDLLIEIAGDTKDES